MAQWLVKDFDRPSKELVERLREIPTSILSDCMNRFQSMDGGMRPLRPDAKLCGPALTVQSMESCNWAAHHALALARPGDVLVIAARGGMASAVWGHVMTCAAAKQELAGVIVDGCVRDAEANRADPLPLFCRGVCPGGPHKGWPGNIGVPVSCAGVPVLPGDIVVGDDNGVTVVPLSRAEETLAQALERKSMEDEWYRRLDNGETTVDILGLSAFTEK